MARITDTHGVGPLAAGRSRLVQASLLQRYAGNLMQAGGVPTTVLVHPSELTAEQSATLQSQWVSARINALGLPAVLSGGVDFRQLMLSPRDLALTDLAAMTEARVSNLLGVPGYMVGLPQSSDSLVYNTAALTLDFHWRVTLRNLVRLVIGPLSAWALPTGTSIELNRDEYIKPGPLERSQYYATMIGANVMTWEEARTLERFETAAPTETLPVRSTAMSDTNCRPEWCSNTGRPAEVADGVAARRSPWSPCPTTRTPTSSNPTAASTPNRSTARRSTASSHGPTRFRSNRDHDSNRLVGKVHAFHPSRREGLVADLK